MDEGFGIILDEGEDIVEYEEDEIEDIDLGIEQAPELKVERFGTDRRSSPYLRKLARARLLSARASQIEKGLPIKIPTSRLKSNTPQGIALQELEERVLPIKIKRVFPDGSFERWSVAEFIIPSYQEPKWSAQKRQ